MSEETKYPQVTDTQVELWLANPVTRVFVQCLGWKNADSVEAAGTGKVTDSSSADMTHAMLHRSFGHQDAFKEAADPERMLEFYQMIFHPPPKEETNDE